MGNLPATLSQTAFLDLHLSTPSNLATSTHKHTLLQHQLRNNLNKPSFNSYYYHCQKTKNKFTMATENGTTENKAVATSATETPVADPKGKGKGKAVATAEDAPKDVAMDDDDDDEEEDEDEVSLDCYCPAL